MRVLRVCVIAALIAFSVVAEESESASASASATPTPAPPRDTTCVPPPRPRWRRFYNRAPPGAVPFGFGTAHVLLPAEAGLPVDLPPPASRH